MKASANFLQDCMCWLTELSLYTNRINKMQRRLQTLKPKVPEVANEKHSLMVQSLQITSRKLNTLARKIIHTIKQSTNYTYTSTDERKFAADNEDELFDDMKYGYNLFIELQRSFNKYVNEEKVQKKTSKVIEMPALNKVHYDKTLCLRLRKNIS